MKWEKRESLIRFHVMDILVWLDTMDWNNDLMRYALASAVELKRLLAIGQREIEERQRKCGHYEEVAP